VDVPQQRLPELSAVAVPTRRVAAIVVRESNQHRFLGSLAGEEVRERPQYLREGGVQRSDAMVQREAVAGVVEAEIEEADALEKLGVEWMVLALAVAVEGASGVRVGHGVVGAGDGEGGQGSGGRD
jgi:hypothetical protein